MTARVIRDDARMTTAHDIARDDLRRALHRVADAAIDAWGVIDDGRPDDHIDAAMDTLRRVVDRAMAARAAMRIPDAGGTP